MTERELLIDCLRRLRACDVSYMLTWNLKAPSDRQITDVAGVFAIQRDKLDQDYLRVWGKKIGVLQTLEDVLSGSIRPKQS